MVHAWKYLHNIKHIDHHFQPVDNSFVCPLRFNDIWQLDTTPYHQSIQMFAIIPITLGLIYFLITFLSITICYCRTCCKNNNNQSQKQQQQKSMQQQLLSDNNIYRLNSDDENQNSIQPNFAPLSINSHSNLNENIPTDNTSKQFKRVFISQYILALISLCIIIFSISIGGVLNSTIIDIQNNWDESYEPYDTCIAHGYSMENILQSVINQCQSIRNAHLPSDCQNTAVPILDQIIPKIQKSSDYLNKYVSDGDAVTWGNSSQIDPYRKYLIYGGIILLSFIAMLIIISFIKTCTNKYIWANTLLSYFLTFSILLVWIISSIQFAFSIEVSDACVNPQNAIFQVVNMTQDPNMNEETFEIVKYYIYCDGLHAYNPLHNYTMYAYNSLVEINSTIYGILPYAQICNITSQTDILLNDYRSTLNQLREIEQALQCDEINEYLTTITSDLCESDINYWFLLYLLQVVVIILLIVKNCCICTKQINDFNVVMDDDKDENGLLIVDEKQQRRIQILEEEGVDRELSVSPPVVGGNSKDYTDDDIKKCLRYLLKFIDSDEQLEKKGNELETQGYNSKKCQPLNSNVVRKSIAILKNYRLKRDSGFVHPLLYGLV